MHRIEKLQDKKELYGYYCEESKQIPYWFPVDFENWEKSMFGDTDSEGDTLFSSLETYVARANGEIVGFVQFGISDFIFALDGSKDKTKKAGIIRTLYFEPEADCGGEMIRLAREYFKSHGVQEEFAFFHAFGMSCCASHGKLFCGLPHIEKALLEAGFVKEHENVYYSRTISEKDALYQSRAQIKIKEPDEHRLQYFDIFEEKDFVGAGCLMYPPQGGICYLKWIFVEEKYHGKGYASDALRAVFSMLVEKGIAKIDTDTADGNIAAQHLYEKLGFENMGRSRSYLMP